MQASLDTAGISGDGPGGCEWASIRSGSAPSCKTRTEIIACAKPSARRCGGAGWLASRLCQLPSAMLIEGMWRDEVARDSTLGGQANAIVSRTRKRRRPCFVPQIVRGTRYPSHPARKQAVSLSLVPCHPVTLGMALPQGFPAARANPPYGPRWSLRGRRRRLREGSASSPEGCTHPLLHSRPREKRDELPWGYHLSTPAFSVALPVSSRPRNGMRVCWVGRAQPLEAGEADEASKAAVQPSHHA